MKNKTQKTLHLTFCILSLLLCGVAFGVNVTINGPSVSASISTAGEADWFSFVVTTSGTYKIETTAGTLTDTYMYLYGPNNQTTLIEEDDDDGVGNASLISRSLSAGTYYVKIRAFSPTATGTYSIRVSSVSTTPTPSIVSLTIGASATSASIGAAGETDWFSFVVSTSGTYKVETTAGTLSDTYMYLYGPGNKTTLIEEDDDDGAGNASLISNRTLSAGTYYVKVRAYSSTATGTYSIRVSGSTEIPPTDVLLTIGASATSASIGAAGETDWFSFVVSTSGTYKAVETTAGTLSDTYMYLYGPGNKTTLIEEDDDDGVGNASLISNRNLSAGTYYVKIRAFSSSGTGTYTIRVTTMGRPLLLAVAQGAANALGDTLYARYEQEHKKYLAFVSGEFDLGVSVGLSGYMDLADYMQITPEGQSGWVTLWLRGTGGISLASAGLPLAVGFCEREFNLTNNLPDREFPWEASFSLFSLQLPGWGVDFVSLGSNGAALVDPEFGTVTLSASFFSLDVSTASISCETRREVIDDAIAQALAPGLQNTTMGIAILTNFFDPDHTRTNGHEINAQFRLPGVRWPNGDYTDDTH